MITKSSSTTLAHIPVSGGSWPYRNLNFSLVLSSAMVGVPFAVQAMVGGYDQGQLIEPYSTNGYVITPFQG